jgi:uncharacterized membrane protein
MASSIALERWREEKAMDKSRVAAFSDGVIAIIITIMVLELKVPHGSDMNALMPLVPVFLSYGLSFFYVATYWHNHHHLLHMVGHMTGPIMWANTHLLFWLSLIPFATGFMGENNFARLPTIVYGISLLMPAIAYYILTRVIIRSQGEHSRLAQALGRDVKGYAALFLYVLGTLLAIVSSLAANAVFLAVALMWFVPDRRIEKEVARN